jgi:TATA-box binding protein (TBP) (component of TFIID and TFIIIB)
MIRQIKLSGEEIGLTIKALCHKGDYGNYKFTIEKDIKFDLKDMSEKLKNEFEVEKVHKLFMIISKPPISISVARHGKIMIEKVTPDTPEAALNIAEKILNTIPGYQGLAK